MKSRSSLLAPAHPGGPGKRAVKRLCVCVCLFGVLVSVDILCDAAAVVGLFVELCWNGRPHGINATEHVRRPRSDT